LIPSRPLPSGSTTLPSVLLLLVFLGGAACSAPPASSQQSQPSAKSDYALIFGTVWGPDSRPVAGVPVRMRRASEKKFRWEMVSNTRGEFAQRVPPGTQDYVIQADIKTPKGQPKPETTVHIDDNERKDISLRLPASESAPH
jgi:hypothetical protein